MEWLLLYPASGIRMQTSGAFNVIGSNGYAWSCAVSEANVSWLEYRPTYVGPTHVNSRAYSFAVRCVQSLLMSYICILLYLSRLSDPSCTIYG